MQEEQLVVKRGKNQDSGLKKKQRKKHLSTNLCLERGRVCKRRDVRKRDIHCVSDQKIEDACRRRNDK